jgi:hypothetical protein
MKREKAGQPKKFKDGTATKRLQTLVPIEKLEQVKNCIEVICADELNKKIN